MRLLIAMTLLASAASAQTLPDDRAFGRSAHTVQKSASYPTAFFGNWLFLGSDCVSSDGKVMHTNRLPDGSAARLQLGDGYFDISGVNSANCLVRNAGSYKVAEGEEPYTFTFNSMQNRSCAESYTGSWALGRDADSLTFEASVKRGRIHLKSEISCYVRGQKGKLIYLYDPEVGS